MAINRFVGSNSNLPVVCVPKVGLLHLGIKTNLTVASVDIEQLVNVYYFEKAKLFAVKTVKPCFSFALMDANFNSYP